ncbi:DUF294 nucleotidyltransferase-like domain-containing protein, partial [Gammaproteobacteria bacterium]|nr:DUF294 nucleotidyltransferase-like domain-containing protein [Gammaproteobacteria bacterium]
MIEPEAIRQFIGQHEPFNVLDAERQSLVIEHLKARYVRRDTHLLEYEQQNDTLYWVRSGLVDIYKPDGSLFHRAAEGEYFGYFSLLLGGRCQHNSRVIEDALLYTLPGEIFQRLRRESLAFDRFFNHAHQERLHQALAGLSGGASPLMSTTLRHYCDRLLHICPADTSIRDAATLMSEHRISSLLIGDSGQLDGILTDRDLRSRVVACGISGDEPVSAVMTDELITIDADALAFEAMLTMTQHTIRHLPIVDRAGVGPLGIVSITDLLRLQSNSSLFLVRDIAKRTSHQQLADVSAKVPAMVAQLVETDARALHVGRVVTTVNDALCRRLIDLAIADLGEPPMPWCWVALGSQARQEQSALSDQDNGLILAEPPTPEADAYFAEFAKRVSDGLDRCGYVYCPGNVMATNPAWRQPLSRWIDCFDRWIDVPKPEALM